MKKHKYILPLVLILFALWAEGRASMPSSEEILQKVFEKYSEFQTYSSKVKIKKSVRSGGSETRFMSTYSIDMERPNKFSLRHIEGPFGRTMVSDGQDMWVYIPSLKKYTRVGAPRHFEDILQPALDDYRDLSREQFAVFSFIDVPLNFVDISRASPPYSEEIEGKVYYIITIEDGEVNMNLRIDRDDFTLAEIKMDMTLPVALHHSEKINNRGGIEINYIETHDEVSFDHETEEQIFAFTPPEGAEAAEDILMHEKTVYPFRGADIGTYSFTDPRSGDEFTVSDFQGQVVLICFISPGEEISQAFVRELAARREEIEDVKILLVARQGQKKELVPLLEEWETFFTGALDSKPYIADSLGLIQLPGVLTVGREGRLQQIYTGYFEDLSTVVTEEAALISKGMDPAIPRRSPEVAGMDLKWNIPLNVSSVKASESIYALSPTGRLYTISPEGAVVDAFYVPENYNRLQLSGGNGENKREFILYRKRGQRVEIVSEEGQPVSNISAAPGINTLISADLNLDGNEEIILGLSGLAGLSAVSKDGTAIFTSSRVHNVVSLDLIKTDGEVSDILAVSGCGSLNLFSPGGEFKKEIETELIVGYAKALGDSILVSGSVKGNEIIQLLNYSGKLQWELILGEYEGAQVLSAAFHPFKSLFACGMRNGRIVVFDTDGNIHARAGTEGINLSTQWFVFEKVQVNLIASSRETGITSYAITGKPD